jgi:hypothetical protein
MVLYPIELPVRLAHRCPAVAKVKAARPLKGRIILCYGLISPEWKVPAIRAAIAWARRAGFHNIAAELQDTLLLLPSEDEDLRVGVKQASRR